MTPTTFNPRSQVLTNPRSPRGLGESRPPTWLLVFLGYLVMTIVATWPLVLDPGGHFFGKPAGDGIGGIAYFDTWRDSIFGGHPGFDGSLSYPFGANLRTNAVPPLYLALELLMSLVMGSTVAYNALAFLSFPLSAMGCYLLGRFLHLNPAPAFAAGTFFGFTAYHAGQAAVHTTLPHTEVFPLVLLAFLAWRRHGGTRLAVLAGLATALTFMWDYYFAIFVSLMLGATITSLLVTDVVSAGIPRGIFRAAQSVAIGLLGVAFSIPFFLLIKSGLQGSGVGNRNEAEVLIYAARPCQLLLPWSHHPELGKLGCPDVGLPPAETALYVGMIALGLTLVLLLSAVWRGLPHGVARETWVVVPVAIVGLAWAMPTVWQAVVHTSPPALLWMIIPGLRVSARAVVLLQLGLAILGGAGLQVLLALRQRGVRWRRRSAAGLPKALNRQRVAWLVTVLVSVAFFGESLGVSTAAQPLPHPAVNDWLATRPRGTVIIQFPPVWAGTASEGTAYFYDYYHHLHHLNEVGTTLAAPNQGGDLAAELWHAGTSTAGELRAAGVRYAVSHTGSAYDLRDAPDSLAGLPGLVPVWSEQGDTVYEVIGPPVPFGYLAGDFQMLEQHDHGTYARWMGATGRVELENPLPRTISAILHVDAWCLGGCRSRVVVRGDGADQHLTEVGPDEIHVELPPGHSHVDLIPPNPPRRISAVEDRMVTLYLFRPVVTMVSGGT